MQSSTLLCAPNSLSPSPPLSFPQKLFAPFINYQSFSLLPLSSLKFCPRRFSPLHSTAAQEVVELGESEVNEPQFVEIGYISGVHGLQGEVLVKPTTGFPELRFSKPGRRWLKQQHLGREMIQEVELVEGRGHQGRKSWIVRFSNIDEVEQAQELVGSTLLVSDEDRPELEEGEYYSRDLVGMRVILKETGQPVGTVVNVFDTGASDLLHVRLDSSMAITDKNGNQRSEAPLVFIPFVDPIVPDVDMDKREMLITPPKGLLELNIRSDMRTKKERRQLEWTERKKFQKRLIAAKKKLAEMEQKHVFDGFRHGEKAQGSLLADQIVGVNSKLLQIALRTIEMPSDRWHLSEFLADRSREQMTNTYKISKGCLVSGDKEYASSQMAEKHQTLASEGKVATVLVVGDTKRQETSDSSGTDILLQRLVKIEDSESIPLILVCPADAIDTIQSLFSDNDHFGVDPEKVWFLEEEKLPVVSTSLGENNKHKILMKSPWEILQTPIGSGGVLSLLSSHDILDNLENMGVEYVEVCSVNEKYVGGENLLGLVDSSKAHVGIKTFKDINEFDDDFYVVFSMKFMKELTNQIEKLHFQAISKPNQHVQKVDKEWVDVIPSSPNSFEFRSSIYSSLKACPLDKVCIMEVVD